MQVTTVIWIFLSSDENNGLTSESTNALNNKYFNDSEPWAVKKDDPVRMKAILFTIVNQIKNISILLNPIIPNATNRVLDMINVSTTNINIDKIKDDNVLNNEKEIGNLEILFTKI